MDQLSLGMNRLTNPRTSDQRVGLAVATNEKSTDQLLVSPEPVHSQLVSISHYELDIILR